MAGRLSDDLSLVTIRGEKGNLVKDVSTLTPLMEKDEKERKEISEAIFFEPPPSLSSHISVSSSSSSSEESPERIVDSFEVMKELVEPKYDISERKTAFFSHSPTSPSKETLGKNKGTELEPSEGTDLVTWSKAVSKRSLWPSKHMRPSISSKTVSVRNLDYTKSSEFVQKNVVSKTKTTSKAVFIDSRRRYPFDIFPPKYNISLYDVDSPVKIARAEAIVKVRNLYDERNNILKMHLRKGPARRTNIKDTLTRKTGTHESLKDTLSEVELQTIADVALEKVDAATQTDEVFCSAIFHQLEGFRETTFKTNLNSSGSAAAAATTSVMVPLQTNSTVKSRQRTDFNDLDFYGMRNEKYFADLEQSITVSKAPIKWEDVKISWQPTPTCYTPSIESFGKDDSIAKTFSEMYDEVDQVMDSLRLWESKHSGFKEQPGFNTDIAHQRPDTPCHSDLVTLKDEKPTTEESSSVQNLPHNISSESVSNEKSLELLAQSDQETSPEDIMEPSFPNLEEQPQVFKFSYPPYIFPSDPVDIGQYNSSIEETDESILISSESGASVYISGEAEIRTDKEQAGVSSHPTLSGEDFQVEEPPLTSVHGSIQSASAVTTHSNKSYSKVDSNSESVLQFCSFEPDGNSSGSADKF